MPMTATAITNDIKMVSGLHNSTLIMFDTAAYLSSASKDREQIQAALCQARAVFSYSGNPERTEEETQTDKGRKAREREG